LPPEDNFILRRVKEELAGLYKSKKSLKGAPALFGRMVSTIAKEAVDIALSHLFSAIRSIFKSTLEIMVGWL
jgi:hypothetical protein